MEILWHPLQSMRDAIVEYDVWLSSYSKTSFTKTISRRFKKTPFWVSLSKICVYGARWAVLVLMKG